MLDDALRRRLEALNRGPLPIGRRTPSGASGGWDPCFSELPASRAEGLPSVSTRGTRVPTIAMRPPANLIVVGEEVQTSAGKHLRIVQPVDAIWPNGGRLVAARHAILVQSPPRAVAGDDYRNEARALVDSFPDRIMFLDLETCGLSGAALFLVGLLRRIDGRLAVELLLARNYAEEQAVLVSLWERAAAHDVLVTFNGKSFDWPMVQDRSTRYLLDRDDPRPELIHIDILHHARRRWRGRLPNCKLQTLERYICGRRRQDDIPGAQIPAAYQRFVETGEPHEMESILYHNAVDLVTLLDLSMRLAGD